MKLAKGTKKFIRNVFFVFIACVTASSFYSTIARIGECREQIKVLNEQIADEKGKNEELNKIKKNVHSDENYERIARDTLGLVNPGDKVYVNSEDNR